MEGVEHAALVGPEEIRCLGHYHTEETVTKVQLSANVPVSYLKQLDLAPVAMRKIANTAQIYTGRAARSGPRNAPPENLERHSRG